MSDLFEAIEAGDLARVAQLLEPWPSHKPTWPHWTPLHEAIEALEQGGSWEVFILLVRRAPTPDLWDKNHESTPLLMALFRGQAAAAQVLLAAGADPTVVGAEGDSPLLWCAQTGQRQMAALLLAAGAGQTIDRAGGIDGLNALGWAARRLDTALVELLLAHGADPTAPDADYQTARQRVGWGPQRAPVLKLLGAPADPAVEP